MAGPDLMMASSWGQVSRKYSGDFWVKNLILHVVVKLVEGKYLV